MRPLRFVQSCHRRQGLTLIEVVVVVAILIVVGGLLFPAIQCARESARRSQCRNNLKQIGLGLHGYHDTFNLFPPGYVLDGNGVYHGWGWGVMMTPYLDASPYYNMINFAPGLQGEYAKPNVNWIYPVYRCPTDGGSSHVEHASIVTTNVRNWVVTPGSVDAANVFSRTNYFAMAGYLQSEIGGINADASGEPPDPERHVNAGSLGNTGSPVSREYRYCDQQNFRGIFGQNSNTRIREITDGTINTLMVGERYTPANSRIAAIGHGTFVGVPDCSTPAGLAMSLGDASIRFNSGAIHRKQTTGFGSQHGRGAHFLFGDGSVKFLADNIDVKVYRDMSTIDECSRNAPEDASF